MLFCWPYCFSSSDPGSCLGHLNLIGWVQIMYSCPCYKGGWKNTNLAFLAPQWRRALLPIVTHKVVNSQAWGKCSRCQAVKTTAITGQMSSTVSSCLENEVLKEKYLESMWKFDLGWLICWEIKGMSTKNVEWKITSKQGEMQLKNKKTIQSKSRQRT